MCGEDNDNDNSRAGISTVSLGFQAELFPAATHLCYLYNDDEERQRVVAGFVQSGLAAHECVGCFLDVTSPAAVSRRLREWHIPEPPPATLKVSLALDVYCPNGRFTPATMLDTLRRFRKRALDASLAGARVTGEMEWALQGMHGAERIVEYESMVNVLLPEQPMVVFCQYDTRKFDGGTLFDVLNVHPMMLVRGQVVRNPYYVPPERYLGQDKVAALKADHGQ